jgi:hypothetical protein
VLHTYSYIFQSRINKVRMLPVPSLPDELDHQSVHCVEERGGRCKNTQSARASI